MEEYKTLLASKTIWGGIIALAAGIAGLFGYSVHPADQATIVEVGTALASAVGGGLAVVGRIKATKKIGKQ
jgi:multidrug efflux pump subunit AcrA (membrane-fusion protein)